MMLLLMIAAVTGTSIALAVAIWAAWKETERAEVDSSQKRRILLRLAVLYIGCAAFGIAEVVAGKEPRQSLLFLPIPAALAWAYLRAASRVKSPPR
jgi:membrane protein implicated in regulation of membrane protease activity